MPLENTNGTGIYLSLVRGILSSSRSCNNRRLVVGRFDRKGLYQLQN